MVYALSVDPGFVNLGWSIVSIDDKRPVFIVDYGIFKICDYSATGLEKQEIANGVKDFVKEVVKKMRFIIDFAIIEDQPCIRRTGDMTNFKLQMIDMALRGALIGAGLELYTVHPNAMRLHYNIRKGTNALNKKASCDIFKWNRLSLDSTRISFEKQHHIIDSYLNACFFSESREFSNMKPRISVTPLSKYGESSIQSSWAGRT